jgi:hypothetical protein
MRYSFDFEFTGKKKRGPSSFDRKRVTLVGIHYQSDA